MIRSRGEVNFILLGSFLLAFAIEEVGLQNRLALKLLCLVPGEPKAVLLAIMGVSAVLSAFMSNTATASLMCPLAKSLYEEVKEVNAAAQLDTEVLGTRGFGLDVGSGERGAELGDLESRGFRGRR